MTRKAVGDKTPVRTNRVDDGVPVIRIDSAKGGVASHGTTTLHGKSVMKLVHHDPSTGAYRLTYNQTVLYLILEVLLGRRRRPVSRRSAARA